MSAGRAHRVSWAEILGFMRAVARMQLRDIDAETIRRFQTKQVPWDSVLVLAEMEGITGFLQRHRHEFSTCAGETVLKKLADRCDAIRIQTADRVDEVGRIAARLDRTGIQTVALQGLSLLPLYGDQRLRPLGDVDLLVEADQKVDVIRLLVECGFTPAAGHYPDLMRRQNLCIDLHTHILDRLHHLQALFPRQALYALRLRSAPLYGASIRAPEKVDNLLALCVHALKHGYSRLIWLVDLHELLLKLQKDDPNAWGSICARARAWQQEKTLLYALLVLESVFGLALPESVTKNLGLTGLGSVEKFLLRRVGQGYRSACLPHMLYLHMLDGGGARMNFLREALYPEPEAMSQVLRDRRWKQGFPGYLRRLISTGLLAAADLKRAAGCRTSN